MSNCEETLVANNQALASQVAALRQRNHAKHLHLSAITRDLIHRRTTRTVATQTEKER